MVVSFLVLSTFCTYFMYRNQFQEIVPFFASNMKVPRKLGKANEFIGLPCSALSVGLCLSFRWGVSLEGSDATDCEFDLVMLINETLHDESKQQSLHCHKWPKLVNEGI